MKSVKHFVVGLIIGAFIVSPLTVSAKTLQKVEAYFAKFNFIINGEVKTLEVDPLVYQGSTYLPVRVVANMLGYDVVYRADSRTIELMDGSPKSNFNDNLRKDENDLENNNIQNSTTNPENTPINETMYNEFKNSFTIDVAIPDFNDSISVVLKYTGNMDEEQFKTYWNNLQQKEQFIKKMASEIKNQYPNKTVRVSLYFNTQKLASDTIFSDNIDNHYLELINFWF